MLDLLFQSSIAPKGDRYVYKSIGWNPAQWFQSSIAPKGDRYFYIATRQTSDIKVSILDRPERRPLR